MTRSSLAGGSLTLMLTLVVGTTVQAQGLLERLEKRLEGVLGDDRPATPAPARPVQAGYLGLTGDDDESGRGVKVLSTRAGGPAEAGGLQSGDVIISAGGAVVTKLEDLESQLEGKLAGQKIEFKIDRGGKQQNVSVALGKRPSPLAPDAAPAAGALPPPRPEPEVADAPPFPAARPSLGITALPVTEEARRKYNLTVRQGALIGVVNPGGAADRAGLPVGGVIVAADGRRVDQPDDLIGIVKAMRPGEKLVLSYYQGNNLFRKTVTLAEAAAEARVVAGEEPRLPPDRPLLRKLERVIEGAAGGAPAIPLAPEAGDLRDEVVQLRARVVELERRLTELEGRLEPKRPAAEEDPAEDVPIRLNPPKPPAPPKKEE
jgi:hypothetical protein